MFGKAFWRIKWGQEQHFATDPQIIQEKTFLGLSASENLGQIRLEAVELKGISKYPFKYSIANKVTRNKLVLAVKLCL